MTAIESQPVATSSSRNAAPACTSAELLAVVSARLLEGRSVVFAGHGLPTLAVALAQEVTDSDIELIYESGVAGARPNDLPLSISDSILVPGAACVLPMAMLFNYVLQGERIDVGFLGAAQIDKFGSLNSTLIGDKWDPPATRLPGSGGAVEVMAGAREVFVVMRRHNPTTFVEELDFCTTPSPHAAHHATAGSMPSGSGVTHLISELGVLTRNGWDEELTLVALQPNVTVEEVLSATGWPLKVAEDVASIAPPSPDELKKLRLLDPNRIYLR
jgi:glutaconate CoA-transferase subunit B